MDTWICEWLAGWIDGCMDEWVSGWMDGCICGFVNAWIGGWLDGYVYGWVGRRVNERAVPLERLFKRGLDPQTFTCKRNPSVSLLR